MNVTADISMYPLYENHIGPIESFIRQLRTFDNLEIVTNQLSTQVRGEFDTVSNALNSCMRNSMQEQQTVVFVVRYLNLDLDISKLPHID
jgi:uncharacterized protein YqgV (UPF0045/DUF77 family)